MALEAQEVVIRARLMGGNAVKAEAERVEASIKKIGDAGNAVNGEGAAGAGLLGFFGKASKSADTIAGKLDGVSKKSLQLGRQTAVLSAGAAGLIYESVKAYSSFTRASTLLQTQVAGTTTKQREELERAALAFGKFGFNGTEVTEAFYPVHSVFKNVNKDLEVMKASAMGAAVGHETLANAADAVSSAMASGTIGVHGPVEEMNLLHLAVGAGKMHLPTLIEMFKTRIFPTASSMGINQRALLGLLAGVSQTVGEGGAVSYASVFRTLLSKLTGFKGAALKAARGLGLNEHTLQDESRQGPFGLVKVLQTLRGSLATVGLDRWQKSINEMFGGSRSASTMLTAIQALSKVEGATSTLAREHGTRAFEQAFGQTQQTPAQQFKVLKAQTINTAIELGKVMTPSVLKVLKDLVSFVKILADGFKALPGPLKDGVVGLVAFSALLAPGAFLFAGLSGFAGVIFKVSGFLLGMGGGSGALATFGGRLGGLAASGGPILLFGAALAALTLELGKHPFNAWEEAFTSIFGGHTAKEREEEKRLAVERNKFLHSPKHLAEVHRAHKLYGRDIFRARNPVVAAEERHLEHEVGRALKATGNVGGKIEFWIHHTSKIDGRVVTDEVERLKREHLNRR